MTYAVRTKYRLSPFNRLVVWSKFVGGIMYAAIGDGPAWLPVESGCEWVFRLCFPEFFLMAWWYQLLGLGA